MASASGVSYFSTVCERFTDSGSESAGDLTQGIQYVFFPGRLHLLLSEDLSAAAVRCAQSEHVLAAEAGDGAVEDGRACGALADLAGDRWSEPRIRVAGPSFEAPAGYARL